MDEAQLTAHRRLLPNCQNVIRLKWADVIKALNEIKPNAVIVERYLLEQFLAVTENFKSKRRSSGMPKEIIGGRNKHDELHFVITGSLEIRPYTVEKVYKENKEMLNDNLSGIQAARRWIANYIYLNKDDLPIEYKGMETIVSDFCVNGAAPLPLTFHPNT